MSITDQNPDGSLIRSVAGPISATPEIPDKEPLEALIKALVTAGGARPFTDYAIADLRTYIEGILQERDTLREHAEIDRVMLTNCRRERAVLEAEQRASRTSESVPREELPK